MGGLIAFQVALEMTGASRRTECSGTLRCDAGSQFWTGWALGKPGGRQRSRRAYLYLCRSVL